MGAMTRGKHAAQAAVRRSSEERDLSEASYQRKIRELLSEVEGLKRKLEDADRKRVKQVDNLAKQLVEGTSSKVLALESELVRTQSKLDHALNSAKHDMRLLQSASRKLMSHARGHGMSETESYEWIRSLMGFDAQLVSHDPPDGNRDAQRAALLDRARGRRSRGDIQFTHADDDGVE